MAKRKSVRERAEEDRAADAAVDTEKAEDRTETDRADTGADGLDEGRRIIESPASRPFAGGAGPSTTEQLDSRNQVLSFGAGDPTDVSPNPLTQVLVDLGRTGGYTVHPAPAGWSKDRTLTVHGRNVEHVDEDEHGRWRYRSM